jgi:catechol 2,3-dioxygenase-like lactoylglutathione lyase family enzyme
MSAIKIRGLDHVVLRVADLERSKAFYRDVLGCPEEKWQPDLGLLQMRAGRALIDLVDGNGKLGRRGGALAREEGRNVDHFCVQLAEFDETALRTHLAAHGVTPGEVVQRYGAEGYGRSMYITDPDGNQVELKAPAD